MTDYTSLNQQLANETPYNLLTTALETFDSGCAISFSGAEDVLLIEYAHQWAKANNRTYRVFSLDTGRLHPQTYRFFQAVEERYGIRIEYCFPAATEVQDLVRAKGMYSFYADGHKECCDIRKVNPLRQQLSGLTAWVTGQRRDQSPTRGNVPVVQVDPVFRGAAGGELIKWNPLANMSSEDVWLAIRALEVPYNALHDQGFVSIGCEPCTKAILPSQHEREGRWWWEEATKKECGLHQGNLKT